METKQRQILHVDVNNAFLSWTALDRLSQGEKIDIREIEAVIGGDEICPAAVYRLAGAAAGEPGIACHHPGQAAVCIELKGVNVQQGLHLDASQALGLHPFGKCAHYRRGLGGAGVHAQSPSAFQPLGQFFR